MTTADIMFAQPGNPESLRDHEYEKRTILLALLAAILIHLLVAFFLAAFGGVFSPTTPVEDKPSELTFMDLAPMLLICTPIFLPVIKTFGIDPVHFGIVMILNLGIGLLTPPVGPTMVVGCAIGKVSMEAVSKSIIVFYIPMIIVLFLITYIPALCLWLPRLVLD